jgi:hypothetical protein
VSTPTPPAPWWWRRCSRRGGWVVESPACSLARACDGSAVAASRLHAVRRHASRGAADHTCAVGHGSGWSRALGGWGSHGTWRPSGTPSASTRPMPHSSSHAPEPTQLPRRAHPPCCSRRARSPGGRAQTVARPGGCALCAQGARRPEIQFHHLPSPSHCIFCSRCWKSGALEASVFGPARCHP